MFEQMDSVHGASQKNQSGSLNKEAPDGGEIMSEDQAARAEQLLTQNTEANTTSGLNERDSRKAAGTRRYLNLFQQSLELPGFWRGKKSR